MLGKLIKNTFKSHASAIYNIYIAMGIITVIMAVLLFVDWTKWGDTGIGMGLAIKGLAAAALCVTAAIAIIMTFVAVFSEFGRSMYAREGHLTMTLPVKSSSLLFSKWISGSAWVIIAYLAFCLAAGGSFVYLMRHSMSLVEGDEMYYSVYELITELVRQLCEASGIVTPSMTVMFNLVALYAISGGIKACVFVLTVYFAITLSHCRPFNKPGKAGRILYFFGATFIILTVSSVMTKLVKVYLVVSETQFTFTLKESEVAAAWKLGYGAFSITNTYTTCVLAVFLFLLTAFLIDRKINVD